MTRRRLAMAVASLLALGSAQAQAASREAEKQARASFERGEAHFKAGLFAEALAEYRAGYEQLPLPGFLINIAQCQRRLGDLAQARATYEKFLMVAPDSPYVPEVKSLMAELDRLVEAAEERPSPPAVGAEASPAGTRAPPAPVERAAVPVARVDEPPASNLVAAPKLPPEPAESGTRWWLWGGIGAAVAVGAAVTAYALWPTGTTTVHEGSLGTLRR
ncbi:MAG: hypothetical protein JXP73_15235 [Deltaproteobacteria bacterium]|nr:hypothetical protein [Deltaproteobacteria bacterium]